MIALVVSTVVLAQSLVPGRDDPGFDAALEAKANGYVLELQQLTTVPLGFGLEAFVLDPKHRAVIDAFFDAGAPDFKAFSGLHPYDVVDIYAEEGDLGMFGGVQAAGDAFRYAVLRDSGAPQTELDNARAALVRTMNGLHWFTQITGVPGATARGLRRIKSEPGEPPYPGGPPPATVPMFDDAGQPLPPGANGVWRADQSGELPFLIWADNPSKDQLDGYVFALGVAYDVTVGDPTFPQELVKRLQADAAAIGRRLMTRVEVAPGMISDLVIVDPNGRPTGAHDLSAEEFLEGAVAKDPINGFNALMSLGIMRTLFHISGDEALGRFYDEELVTKRNYPGSARSTTSIMYLRERTNYSNVNMAFLVAYDVLRYENDPTLARRYRDILEKSLYHPGVPRQAGGLGQSLFDFIYAGFHEGGSTTAAADGLATLRDWPSVPWWYDEVKNCDEDELDAGVCTAIDGTTRLELTTAENHGGDVTSTTPLPMRLRPPSDFMWRDDPHTVNGGGWPLLCPGGDFHAAYWMGRFLKANGSNISPNARSLPGAQPMPMPLPMMPAKTGCGCDTGATAFWLLALVVIRSIRRSV